jgi:hypothetical protein
MKIVFLEGGIDQTTPWDRTRSKRWNYGCKSTQRNALRRAGRHCSYDDEEDYEKWGIARCWGGKTGFDVWVFFLLCLKFLSIAFGKIDAGKRG